MWCKKCNKISYNDICEVCGEKTQLDVPTEIFWCSNCQIPLIKELTHEGDFSCPICGGAAHYLSKDLRPVFPQERLLIEILENKPLAYVSKSVWAADSRYYIDGKASVLSIEKLKKVNIEVVRKLLEEIG